MGVALVDELSTHGVPRRCALFGCDEPIEDVVGRPQRLYCSPAHRHAARQARRVAARHERQVRAVQAVGGGGSPPVVAPDDPDSVGADRSSTALAARAAAAEREWLAAAAFRGDRPGSAAASGGDVFGMEAAGRDMSGAAASAGEMSRANAQPPALAGVSADPPDPTGASAGVSARMYPSDTAVAAPDQAALPEWARQADLAGTGPASRRLLTRWPAEVRHRVAEQPPARRRAIAVIGAAGIVAGGYALTSTTAPPVSLPTQSPPLTTSEDRWVARAQVTVTSLDRQLDLLARTEEAWRRQQPAPPASSAPMRALAERKALLQRRRAELASRIDTVRSLNRARGELAQSEARLRKVEVELRDPGAGSLRTPEQRKARMAALDEQRVRDQRQRDERRHELQALQDEAAGAVRTPLPDDGERTTEIADEVMESLRAGPDPDPASPRGQQEPPERGTAGEPRATDGTRADPGRSGTGPVDPGRSATGSVDPGRSATGPADRPGDHDAEVHAAPEDPSAADGPRGGESSAPKDRSAGDAGDRSAADGARPRGKPRLGSRVNGGPDRSVTAPDRKDYRSPDPRRMGSGASDDERKRAPDPGADEHVEEGSRSSSSRAGGSGSEECTNGGRTAPGSDAPKQGDDPARSSHSNVADRADRSGSAQSGEVQRDDDRVGADRSDSDEEADGDRRRSEKAGRLGSDDGDGRSSRPQGPDADARADDVGLPSATTSGSAEARSRSRQSGAETSDRQRRSNENSDERNRGADQRGLPVTEADSGMDRDNPHESRPRTSAARNGEADSDSVSERSQRPDSDGEVAHEERNGTEKSEAHEGRRPETKRSRIEKSRAERTASRASDSRRNSDSGSDREGEKPRRDRKSRSAEDRSSRTSHRDRESDGDEERRSEKSERNRESEIDKDRKSEKAERHRESDAPDHRKSERTERDGTSDSHESDDHTSSDERERPGKGHSSDDSDQQSDDRRERVGAARD